MADKPSSLGMSASACDDDDVTNVDGGFGTPSRLSLASRGAPSCVFCVMRVVLGQVSGGKVVERRGCLGGKERIVSEAWTAGRCAVVTENEGKQNAGRAAVFAVAVSVSSSGVANKSSSRIAGVPRCHQLVRGVDEWQVGLCTRHGRFVPRLYQPWHKPCCDPSERV